MYLKICVLFCLLLIEQQAQSQKIKPYVCNTKEKIDEIKDIKNHLKRFIRHDNQIYFVLTNRIIFTKIPAYEQYNSQGVSRFNIGSLVAHQFNEQKNEELKPDRIKAGYKVFGHYYDVNKKETWEYYKNSTSKNSTSDNSTSDNSTSDSKNPNRIFPECYLLNFDKSKGALAKRIKLISDNNEGLLEELKSKPETRYFNAIDFQNELDSSELPGEFIFKYYLDENSINQTGILDIKYGYGGFSRKDHYINLKIERSNIEFFNFYIINFDNSKFYDLNHAHLIEISSDFKIRFAIYRLSSKPEAFGIGEFEYSFEELFNCHTKFNKTSEIKGIYYEKTIKTFFIFIRRYYLQITEDLVRNGFFLSDEQYLKKSKDLKLDKETFITQPSLDPTRKWVKTVGNEALFTLDNSDTDKDYLLISGSNPSLSLEKSPETKKFKLKYCDEQTLLIQNHLFCFVGDKYFYMYELNEVSNYDQNNQLRDGKLISSIFENSPISWNKDNLVSFIFNYDDDYFVLMTKKVQFVFEYSKFEVLDKQIVSKYKSDDEYLKFKNCLLDADCNNPITDATTSQTTGIHTSQTTEIHSNHSNETSNESSSPPEITTNLSTQTVKVGRRVFFDVLMVCLIILIVVFVISIPFYLQYKKRKQKI